jgi:putative ABC transport system permease protein
VGAGTATLATEGQDSATTGPAVCTVGIAGDYFETLALPLLVGKRLEEGDATVAIVNQRFVDSVPGGPAPVGRRIRLLRSNSDSPAPWLTVVGMVPSVRQTPLGDPRPCVHVPLALESGLNLAVLVRTSGHAAGLAPDIRLAIKDLDSDLALYNVNTLQELSHTVRWSSRTISVVLTVFALVAFALSAGGVFAVTSHGVVQRTQEIGVRMALGAGPRDIWSIVAGRTVASVTVGLVIGLAGGAGLTRVMRGVLIGPDAGGLPTLVLLAGVVLAVAALACAIPASRALRIQPVTALREE